jgi:hypothetical protein
LALSILLEIFATVFASYHQRGIASSPTIATKGFLLGEFCLIRHTDAYG